MRIPPPLASGISTFLVVLTAGFVIGLLSYVLWAFVKGAVIQ